MCEWYFHRYAEKSVRAVCTQSTDICVTALGVCARRSGALSEFFLPDRRQPRADQCFCVSKTARKRTDDSPFSPVPPPPLPCWRSDTLTAPSLFPHPSGLAAGGVPADGCCNWRTARKPRSIRRNLSIRLIDILNTSVYCCHILYRQLIFTIYVKKKLQSLYKLCKGDIVVGDIKLQRSPL